MSAGSRTVWRGVCLGVVALSMTSCVSRAQYDRLVTEYYSENEARQQAELELSSLQVEVDDYRLRAEDAESRAARTGSESEGRLQSLADALAAAKAQIEKFSQGGGITVLPTDDGFRILVDDKLLFDSGSATLKSAGKVALNKIAKEVLSQGYASVRIDGHTDTDPVVKKLKTFPLGNHQLSCERALSVFGYLTKSANVPESKLSLAAFGPNRPLVQGNSASAKQRNRRVEIQVTVDAAN